VIRLYRADIREHGAELEIIGLVHSRETHRSRKHFVRDKHKRWRLPGNVCSASWLVGVWGSTSQ